MSLSLNTITNSNNKAPPRDSTASEKTESHSISLFDKTLILLSILVCFLVGFYAPTGTVVLFFALVIGIPLLIAFRKGYAEFEPLEPEPRPVVD